MTLFSSLRRIALLGAVLLGVGATGARADTFVVTNTLDSNGTCTSDSCSLHEAIAAANTNGNPSQTDLITFAPSVTGTINLGTIGDTSNGNSAFALAENVSIQGPGAGALTVRRDTGGSYRLFVINSGVTASISGLTLGNGKTLSSGGSPNGGCIYSSGNLTLANCTLSGNSALGGGALYNAAINSQLTVQNCTLSGNIASGTGANQGGGAISSIEGVSVAVTGSTLSGNSARDGGAMYVDSSVSSTRVTVTNSTLSNNSALSGGAIHINDGVSVTVEGSTLSGNSADEGGAIKSFAVGIASNDPNPAQNTQIRNSTLVNNSATGSGGGVYNVNGLTILDSCTIAGNTAPNDQGGGLYSYNDNFTRTQVRNSIIVGNLQTSGSDGTDVDAVSTTTPYDSRGYNFVGDGAGAGDFSATGDSKGRTLTTSGLDTVNGAPRLAPNGGPTQTVALVAGSAAIDAGSTTLATDQRGFVRPFNNLASSNSGGNLSDIGAVEQGSETAQIAPNLVVTTTDDHNDGVCGVTDCTLREAIGAANAAAGTSEITFDATVFAAPRKTILLDGRATLTTSMNITAPTAGVILGSKSASADSVLQANGGTSTFSGLTFSGNTLSAVGVYGGNLTIEKSTFIGDLDGGVVNVGATVNVFNCTLIGNRRGARTASGTTNIDSCTITGGVSGVFIQAGTVNLNNSLVVGNSTNIDGGRPLASSTNNIIGGTRTEAGLSAAGLAENGGPTQTLALVAGSPAINSGSTSLTTDQRGKVRPYSSTSADKGAFEVQNNVPVLANVVITPSNPKTNDTLTVAPTATDADGAILTPTYQWYKGGSPISGATGDSLDLSVAGNGDKGDSITVTVTVDDGKEAGLVSSTSSAITIQNSAPVVKSVTLTPASVKTGGTLTASYVATDEDGDADLASATPLYQWKNGTTVLAETGATLNLATAGYGDSGDSLTCTVTLSDASGAPASKTSDPVVVGNTAPSITSAVITGQHPLSNAVLAVTVAATDADSDALTLSYQWQKNGNDIVGATSSTLDLGVEGNGDDGDVISVVVTATESATTDKLASSPFTSTGVTIGNVSPLVVSLAPQGQTDAAGTKRTFILSVGDGNGASDITEMWLLVNTTLSWDAGATLVYFPKSGQLYLRRGDDFLPPITIGAGSTGILDNGALRIVGSEVSVVTSADGNTLTLTIPATVRDGLVGQNTLFGRVQDVAGAVDATAPQSNFGFVNFGSYTVTSQFAGSSNTVPTLSAMSPKAAFTTIPTTGTKLQTFVFYAKDEDGIGDLDSLWFMVGKQRDWTNSATFVFLPRTRRLYLRSDDGQSFLGGGQLGSSGIIENSQVKVDLSQVQYLIYADGKNVGLRMTLQPKAGLLGQNNIWLRVQDNAGATSAGGDDLGFVQSGTWNVTQQSSTTVNTAAPSAPGS